MDGDEMIDFIVGIEEDGEPAWMVFHDDLFHLLCEIRSSENSRFRRFYEFRLFHDAEYYLSDLGNGQFGDGFEFGMDILLLVEELVEVGIRNSVVQGVESLSHVLTDEIKDKRVGLQMASSTICLLVAMLPSTSRVRSSSLSASMRSFIKENTRWLVERRFFSIRFSRNVNSFVLFQSPSQSLRASATACISFSMAEPAVNVRL